jgi:hypothetical protein
MSQASPIIGPNKSGLTYRQEDNDGKQALLTQHKGPAAPGYAAAGTLWLDDAATPWALKLYDGAQWITLMQVNAASDAVMPYLGTAPIRVALQASDTGTANVYALAPVPAIASYEGGQMFLLRPANANTGASTVEVNGLSPVPILMPDGTPTPAAALKTTGAYLLLYTGAHFVVMNPSAANGGGCLQMMSAVYSSSGAASGLVAVDDSTPTASEGIEVMSISITPKSATSKIEIVAEGVAGHSGSGHGILSIYVGTGGPASFTTLDKVENTASKHHIRAVHAPGSTAPVIYKARVGSTSGSLRFNGNYGGRLFGGAMQWTMTVKEYEQ